MTQSASKPRLQDRSGSAVAVALRLFVAGQAPSSVKAQANLKRALATAVGTKVDVKVVDVLRDPMVALAQGILVTPTLLRDSPQPTRMLVGSLDDAELLAELLNPQ